MNEGLSKQDLYEKLKGRISITAIKPRDSFYVVVGKFCIVELLNDVWDIWLCNTKDLTKGLSTKKLNLLAALFEQSPYKLNFTILNGEAIIRTKDVNFIIDNLKALGLRAKRIMSDERRKRLIEQLAKIYIGNMSHGNSATNNSD